MTTPRMPHHCGRCQTKWAGQSMCHCQNCHRTFTNVASFDAHRVGPVDSRACSVEKLAEVRPGTWGTPGPVSLGHPVPSWRQ